MSVQEHSSYSFPGGFSVGIATNRLLNSSIAGSESRWLNRPLSCSVSRVTFLSCRAPVEASISLATADFQLPRLDENDSSRLSLASGHLQGLFIDLGRVQNEFERVGVLIF